MRLAGLSLCLMVSTLSARAEALEDRLAALESQIKVLQQALQTQLPMEMSAGLSPADDQGQTD